MEDIEVLQWFFDLEKIAAGCNWQIDAKGLLSGKRRLDEAIAEAAPAAEVMEAYQKLSGAIGPDVMKSLLQSDDAFLEINHSGKAIPPNGGKVLLYADKAGVSVWAEVVAEWGMPPKFEVQEPGGQ